MNELIKDLGLLINATLIATPPLLLAALGSCFSERSGVVNIGIEGMMTIGAFTGAVMGLTTGNGWIAFLCAGLAGALFGLIDVVVGCKVAEFLHDVLHLNDYFTRIHMACSSHVYCLLCISFIYLYRIAMRFRFCLQWTGKSQIIFSIKDRNVQTLFSICTDGALHTQAPYRTTHILLCFRMH